MMLSAKRGSISAFAAVAAEAVATYGRRSAHLLFNVLHGGYDAHMERAQMRLTPVRSRTWREIARAGANTNAAQPSAQTGEPIMSIASLKTPSNKANTAEILELFGSRTQFLTALWDNDDETGASASTMVVVPMRLGRFPREFGRPAETASPKEL